MKHLMLSIVSLGSLLAANNHDWENLQDLRRGDRIGVIRKDHQGIESLIEGHFESASDSAIVLNSKGLLTLRQDEIQRVYSRGMSRKKRILIGAVAGLAVGAAAAAGVSRGSNSEGFFSGPSGGAGTVISLGSGTGIGAAAGLFSGRRHRILYERR